ncbi:MAG: hypothetical protein ACI849_001749 [Patiriisocius sp.]|jgi:hypothetical protein
MNIEIEQLYGTWRHEHNGVITDFNIRKYDEDHHTGISLFTIFSWTESGSKINYEWQGAASIQNYPDQISDIVIGKMEYTENKPEYQNLKIWHFTADAMILEFGNGQRVEFQKLGADAG